MDNIKVTARKTKWNLSSLFKGDNDPEMENKRKIVEQKSYEFINKWRDRDDYLKDPAVLKEALDEYENWKKYYGADGDREAYFWLRTEKDKNNLKLKAEFNKVRDFSNKILNDIQFFTLKIARIPKEYQENFLSNEELKNYRHFLEKLFSEFEFLLSENEEKILNLKSGPAYANWVNLTESFLAKEERRVLSVDGKKILRNFSEILSLTSDKKKKVRDSAADALNDIFKKIADIAEAEMNSIMADKKINDELRGFKRPDSAMHLSDDIDSEVVDVLTDSVAKRFDIARKYFRLKAKLFGVKKLKYHERNVEYGDIDKKYDYKEAVNLVYDIFKKIDEDFAEIFKSYVENGQIDAFPSKGKAGGGFCFQHLMSQPTYILLNYTGKIDEVFALAHEAGHGINNELMKRKQNSLNYGTVLFTAEVASKLAESFFFADMLKYSNDKTRLAILMMILSDDISHIFGGISNYLFERELHEQFRSSGYVSKEEIGRLNKKYKIAYMGHYVEQNPGTENWWMHVSHLRVFFYNYQYAGGLLIAKYFTGAVRENAMYMEKVKDFLSVGLSDSPKKSLSALGVNITDRKFWEKGIIEVENLLNETEKLAKKLGKI